MISRRHRHPVRPTVREPGADRLTPMRRDRTQPSVVLEATTFAALCAEASTVPTTASDPDWPGRSDIPGFQGQATTLATFILAANDLLGPYDAHMLAAVARSRPATGLPRVAEPPREMIRIYYFPGLEVY